MAVPAKPTASPTDAPIPASNDRFTFSQSPGGVMLRTRRNARSSDAPTFGKLTSISPTCSYQATGLHEVLGVALGASQALGVAGVAAWLPGRQLFDRSRYLSQWGAGRGVLDGL